MVSLREVDRNNFDRVLSLTVRAEQRCFVADNLFSLAQAKVQPELIPLAVYYQESHRGFPMYGLDEEEKEWWIYRLMVDALAQGRGIGKEALQLAIERISRDETHSKIFISVEPENARARALYRNMGFLPDDRVVDGEIVYRMDY